jgi:predicted dehydrogenase
MTFRIAVIGCGWISTTSHAPVYKRYAASHSDVELVCCDINLSTAEAFRAEHGFARAYSDYQEMLSVEKPNAVCLNVPEHLIAEMGCRIMQMGFPLLAEKPPGLTVAEIDKLIETAVSTGVIHQVAFNRRYAPLMIELKHLLEGHTIHHIDHQFYRIGRTKYDFSTTAIHAIDSIRFLAGCDFQSLRFQYREFPELSRVAPVANFLIGGSMTSNATVNLSISPVAGVNTETTILHAIDHTFVIKFKLNSSDPGLLQHFEKGLLIQEMTSAEFSKTQDDSILSGFENENVSFFNAVREGRQPVDTFASCRQSVEIMQSMRERRPEYHL